jgi:hypothetical protein
MPACSLCAAPATGVCASCFFFVYCGGACQRAHWAAHRPVCAAIRRDAATPLEPHGPDFYPNPPTCHGCGAALSDRVALCTGCEFAGYCSEPCQLAHWDREHAEVCALVREAKDARKAKAEADADAAAAASLAKSARAARKHALRRAHVSLDVGRFTAVETVAALHDFPEDAELAVKALRAFAERIDNQAAVDAGAAPAIVATIRAHAAVTDIARFGCWALASITVLPAGEQALIDAGAAATIITVIRAHESVVDVARHGCRTLAIIAQTPAGQQAVIDAGAAATIVAAIRAHGSDANVTRNGCRALANIASFPAGKLTRVHPPQSSPPCACTQVLLMLHTSDVARWAILLLLPLVYRLLSLRAELKPLSLQCALTERSSGVALTPDDSNVAENGSFALYHFAQVPDGKTAIIAAGGRDSITAAMRHMSAREDSEDALASLS